MATQEAKGSWQVKFLKAHENNTIQTADGKGETGSVPGHLQSFGRAGCQTITASHTRMLVHRRGWWVLSTVRTGGLSRKAGASQVRRPQ